MYDVVVYDCFMGFPPGRMDVCVIVRGFFYEWYYSCF